MYHYRIIRALAIIILIIVNGCTTIKNHLSEKRAEQVHELIRSGDIYSEQKQYVSPKGANAYDSYKKALEIEPSDPVVLKRIHNVLKTLLGILSIDMETYGKLIKEETEGKDVRIEIVRILTKMVNNLNDCNMICEEYPTRDSDTETMCAKLKESKIKYEKLRIYYEQKLNG